MTDSAGETHVYRWDGLGNLVYYDQSGPGEQRWQYNGLGYLENHRNAENELSTWEVNIAGDVLSFDPPETGVWEYRYYPDGRLRQELIPGRGAREYFYDAAVLMLGG